MNKIIILISSMFIFLNSLSQNTNIRIKFLDKENHKRVPFVAITESKGDVFLGSANAKGIFKIETDLKIDSIVCSAIGYKTYIFSINDLKKNKKIYLESNVQHLKEIVVKGFSIDYFLKKSFKKHLENRPKNYYFSFYEYLKTTKVNNKYVEMLHSNGILFNTSSAKHRKWDDENKWVYSPINVKLSNAYTNSNSNDTLAYRQSKCSRQNPDYNTIKSDLKVLNRTIQVWGPINKKFYSYYKYKIDSIYTENNESIYRVYFKSLDKKVPRKFKIVCSGHLYINKDNFFIKKIEFDNIHYSYFFAINPRWRNRKMEQFFKAKASIKYRKINNTIYPKEIRLKKYDFHERGLFNGILYGSTLNNITSRLYKKDNKYDIDEVLIFHDKEPLITNKYCNLQQNKKNYIANQCLYFSYNPKIFYNPNTFITSKSIFKDMPKLIADLNKHEDIEKQFLRHRNMQLYYTNEKLIIRKETQTAVDNFSDWSNKFVNLFNLKTK
ncbi:hypothetical protein E0494_00410 [Marinilabiliaceae bacterium JC040]|nr:hypothetical protein [Marinilabiliaceae bacterium JC040]